jgi:hypothetical protein
MNRLRRSSRTQILTAILLTIVFAITAGASNGDLDLSFGNAGTAGKIAFASNRDGSPEMYPSVPGQCEVSGRRHFALMRYRGLAAFGRGMGY